eukprot:scaffold10422_cov55-Attheya_sp.AAC.6
MLGSCTNLATALAGDNSCCKTATADASSTPEGPILMLLLESFGFIMGCNPSETKGNPVSASFGTFQTAHVFHGVVRPVSSTSAELVRDA